MDTMGAKTTSIHYDTTPANTAATTRSNIDLCIIRLMLYHLAERGFGQEEIKRMEDCTVVSLGATIRFPR